jgi:D-proline reductase (dithiol) PrdB
MASLADLKFAYRLFMRAYPYRKVEWRPGTRLMKPLAEARVAVVTTAGFSLPDDRTFDQSTRGGDCSWRMIPARANLDSLRISHTSDAFDVSGITADKNLALPLDRLRALAEGKVIGETAPRHFSFMGSITAPGRLIAETAPQVARLLCEDRTDVVLLTPV